MNERRPFPPSPRRLALARRAGLSAASPTLVGAVAAIAALVAAIAVARAAVTLIGDWIAAACGGRAMLSPAQLPMAVIELAAPVGGAAALAAIVAHVAQTRALWFPRRRAPGAPILVRGAPQRLARTAFDQCATIALGLAAFGWLWTTAPRMPVLLAEPLAAGAAIASLVATLAIAWITIGVVDTLFRRAELARALAMTTAEKREDDRLAAADPRWRAQQLSIMRGPAVGEAVARSAVVLLGDDIAVAIAWDPTRQPVPLRTAVGRRARATQLVGLARRHHVAVHRDHELARTLADAEGPVPEAHWSRVAEIIAAVRGR
jgi:flagellar biosynthesis protein FlhB